MNEPRRSIKTPTGFLLVLRQGDDVMARLEDLMRDEDIPSAWIQGFGFVSHARLGFFDFERGDYDPGEFEQIEITSMTGTLAWKNGKPAIHAHASGGDRGFGVIGGHVLGLVVGRGSFEINVTVLATRLERRLEPEIGANVLQLG